MTVAPRLVAGARPPRRPRRALEEPGWASAIAADDAAALAAAEDDDANDPNILELGCGVGIIGVAAALLGHRVVATDLEVSE